MSGLHSNLPEKVENFGRHMTRVDSRLTHVLEACEVGVRPSRYSVQSHAAAVVGGVIGIGGGGRGGGGEGGR